MTMSPEVPRIAVQRAAAYCRLFMLGDVDGRIALVRTVEADGPLAMGAFVENLAGLAVKPVRVGRGSQLVRTRQQLLDYFEDMAAVSAMDDHQRNTQ